MEEDACVLRTGRSVGGRGIERICYSLYAAECAKRTVQSNALLSLVFRGACLGGVCVLGWHGQWLPVRQVAAAFGIDGVDITGNLLCLWTT